MRVRRTAYAFFFAQDRAFLDVDALLRGRAEETVRRELLAISILTGEEHPVEPAELELLLATPSREWVGAEDGPAARRLVELGLLVSDADDPVAAELRRRDERLARGGWNAYAAAQHFLTRWRDVDLRGEDEELPPITREVIDAFVDVRGLPPPAFAPARGEARELPVVRPARELYGLLERRRTTRSFERSAPLPLAALATALDAVFGCRGVARVRDGITLLKRTSPSGGAMHPIDAYPLVHDVEGVEPGLYRYDALRHALEPVGPLEPDDAARFVCGQTYFASAHVLVVLAARFDRSHWKYRHHQKAYPALLLDAGHLSQTLYLVATELGLGAFVTAAINQALIDERLGLDGYGTGALAVCGLGVPAAEPSSFDPRWDAFVPRETSVDS